MKKKKQNLFIFILIIFIFIILVGCTNKVKPEIKRFSLDTINNIEIQKGSFKKRITKIRRYPVYFTAIKFHRI